MMKDIIDQLIYERAPWLQAKTAGAAISDRVLKACLRYSKTIETANSLKPLNGAEIFDKLCGEIVQDTEIMGCSNIPTTGPALIVANHPTGIADAVFLYSAIAKTRPDVYFFANSDVLRVFPQLSEFIAPVEWRKEKRTKTRTKETLEFTKQAMKERRIGVIFPSGRLANDARYAKRYDNLEMHKTATALNELSKQYRVDPATLAVAWIAKSKYQPVPIVSARNTEQLTPVLNALNFDMSDELFDDINNIAPRPAPATDRLEEQV
ncbi:MAG: hypothetical protein EBY77_05505 [Rhodobacteraceae bacterium]|nr:hypothetical protein [Paracoccaceae bacterium]